MGTCGRVVGVVSLLGFMWGGCGENENNQGISFRTVGMFQGEQQEDQCQVPVVDDAIADPGIAVPLDGDVFEAGTDELSNGYPDSFSIFSFCRGFLELQNNLFDQAVVVDRIDFDYEIPGARIPIPSNSMPTGIRLNPANADPEQNPNPFGQVNVAFIQLDGQLVPSSLVEFLRQNEPSLPELPYVMIIHVTAQGVTDSGDLLVSNEIRYTVEWTN